MLYYVVDRAGNGTDSDPYRPAVPPLPEEASMMGQWSQTGDFTYLISVSCELTGLVGLTPEQLAAECGARGLALTDVLSWSVPIPAADPVT
jgi:hypothetical protein